MYNDNLDHLIHYFSIAVKDKHFLLDILLDFIEKISDFKEGIERDSLIPHQSFQAILKQYKALMKKYSDY